ncbi:hypothetical protein EV421DRAFT_1840525 [Armillaria borealis]|uniref:Uncharacterized protein n=1 Tax=Armillaria borealis TaxID=47425 RepID=A0AA39MI43_9AGAR|nr:hypothetical protein EV421DRAFT_1840525 [Armillaria borealis]
MLDEKFPELYESRKRNVTLLQTGMQPDKGIPSLEFYIRLGIGNFSLAVWSPEDDDMLLVQLWDNWASLGHHVGFHRYTRSQFGSRKLWSRDPIGVTTWPYNDIVHQGIRITHRGLPYRGSTWHFMYPDHQSFVEELARTITTSYPPSPGPYIPLELTNEGVIEADPSWVPGVPIFGKSCRSDKHGLSKDWTGDCVGFFSIPAGRGRSKGDLPCYSKRRVNYPDDITKAKREVEMPKHLQAKIKTPWFWGDPAAHSPYCFKEPLTCQPISAGFLKADPEMVLIHMQALTIRPLWIAQEHETGQWGFVSPYAVRRIGPADPVDEH